ncbi:MAG: penicillin acylase [Bacteroidetes bacterium]|nr:penicillin acylase [Bacteroidota bacterium]
MKSILFFSTLLFSLFIGQRANACSILYFRDSTTGKVYIANNEDYWYDAKAYIKVVPKSKDSYARLWYGWNNFAQGGVNEFGLFFDGAVTPKEQPIRGYGKPKGNLGDELLAKCKTTQEVVDYLESKKVALTDGHLLIGDKGGNAVVLEWVNGERKLTYITTDHLMVTNFLLADPAKGGYPCPRYQAMENDLQLIKTNHEAVDLKRVGRVIAKAVQVPQKDKDGRTFGTLYSTFINLTDMEFKLVYKLDNSRLTQLDLNEVFKTSKQIKTVLQ